MAIEILVPRLGWTMEEGVFEGWLKQDGDRVAAGEPLFTLEGEKASQDIEAIDGGVLGIPPDAPKPGDVVRVGAVLGYLLAAGEQPPWQAHVPRAAATRPSPEQAVMSTEAGARSKSSIQGEVRRSSAEQRSEPTISPRARRVARELGVDWTTLRGGGSSGRIRERDVRAAHQLAHAPVTDSPGEPRRIPFSPARKTIAARMRASLAATAPVTLTTDADATNLVNLRRQFRDAGRVLPSYTDFFLKLAAAALRQHPMLTAQWTDDGIVVPQGIHIAIAVDTDAGLVAPVVRDVPSLTLQRVAEETQTLIELAKKRRLAPQHLAGGTFTVTNLGMHGIDAFTPIIHAPQCAILGVGRIRREPAVVGDQIVPRDRVTLSLSFDHRVVDGAPAARFLDTLRRYVENPAPQLVV